jgi:hypothetical protein
MNPGVPSIFLSAVEVVPNAASARRLRVTKPTCHPPDIRGLPVPANSNGLCLGGIYAAFSVVAKIDLPTLHSGAVLHEA